MAVPTGSAVLLLHNGHGAFPISAGGGLSRSAAHALDYDARKGEFEDKGGCEREPTGRDRELAAGRALSGDAARHLDYAARAGAWEAGARAMAEDCSYWGQHGPLARDEIERDMLACGGCYLKSVVSVDRRYASELGLDSKAAFEELLRANWQEMMVAAGVAERAEDVRWYACYHTDAEMSLHVHVATWAADGRIGEGWHPSARATREQKAILYRDAYAPVRMQRDLERDYYRMLLPRLAAAEMGERASEGVCGRLRAKAERAGVEEVPLERTLDGRGAAEVARRASAVAARLEEGRGLKARDWKLQSEAGKAVEAIRRNSAAFDAALSRYRQLAEAKADLAGLALSDRGHGLGRGPESKAERERAAGAREVTRHERERFVRREMEDVMRRIRNQVIRSADPEGRSRELAREQADRIRHRLVTASLHPERIGLPPEAADRLRQIYQDAARPQLEAGAGGGAMTDERAAEAARIVASSDAASKAIREAAARVAGASGGAISPDGAREAVRAQLEPRIANALKWRFDGGRVDPLRIGHDRLAFHEERAIARDMVARATQTRGLSLGLARSAGEVLAGHLGAARALAAGRGELPEAARPHVERAAATIARSPAMRRAVDGALARMAGARPGTRAPDRAYVDASMEAAVARRVAAHATAASAGAAGRQPAEELEAPAGAGIAGLVAMVAATIARERGAEAGAARAAGRGASRGLRPDLAEPPDGRIH